MGFVRYSKAPGLEGRHRVLDAAEGGDHDHLDFRVHLLEPLEHGQPVRVGQLVVEEHYFEGVVLHELERASCRPPPRPQ